MIKRNLRAAQRGVATMFVTMVLLVLITLMVVTAYSLSNMNLKTVGNLQMRKEAIASAEKAIELMIDGVNDTGVPLSNPKFWNPAVARTYNIDIQGDTTGDYVVVIDPPFCLRATLVTISSASSVSLPGMTSASAWNTIWRLEANATNVSGTRVQVRHGVRVLMTEADRNLYCGA